MLHKKDKEPQHVGSNLDVKRVKYSYKQTSPGGDDKYSPEQEEQKNKEQMMGSNRPTTSPFQPTSGKDGARVNKGGRRAGPQGGDRVR